VLVQKGEGALAVNLVAPQEEFDFGLLRNLEHAVDIANAGVFMRHPFIQADAIVVAAFDHERPGRDQPRHLCIIIGVGQVEFVHVVLAGEHVAVLPEQRDVFPNPFVEVAGADDRTVTAN
jgi:hypothetical protein